jgi:hypothetical protein
MSNGMSLTIPFPTVLVWASMEALAASPFVASRAVIITWAN